MLKDFKPRLYQETILSTCVNNNCLVVLPTGMGKTSIALMLAVQRLRQYPNQKILLLAPTKPLVDQHIQTFKKYLEIEEDKFAMFTGHVKPEKRQELWKTSQLIFSTPQGLENDVISNRIDLKEVSLMVFDEGHRAVGDYSYVWLAKRYNQLARYPRILALTASPGTDMETISEVCKNLYINEIEVRTDDDPDVKPYIQDVDIKWVKVELPESFKEIQKFLKDCYESKLNEMKKYGYGTSVNGSKKDLLGLQRMLHSEIIRGDKSFELLKSVSLVAEAMKVQHALELLETQNITSLNLYLEKLQSQSYTTKVKAVKNLVRDINFRSALIKANKLARQGIEHPKLEELRKVVTKDKKIIIFTQYRDSGSKIVEQIESIVNVRLFVGQTKKGETGLTQKKQIEMLNDFREGKFNTIVMTSVGEEGLDIPVVDLVIFYEPVPSAIRSIQRRGRTGRTEKGSVLVLMTKDTRDEGYRWSAHHKEKRMHRTLAKLKNSMVSMKRPEQKLDKFIQDEVKIYVDYREKGSGVIKELIDMGINIQLEKLDVGDYLCSTRVGVEYKTTEDFVSSIIDGRLLEQIKNLKHNYDRSVVIVEGIEDVYSIRKIHPNAIHGMLATIAVGYGIPVIYTKTFKETASILATIAKREQEGSNKDFSMHGDKKPMSLKEQQEYVVSALPNIGPTLAKELLTKFSTIQNIVNASEEDLMQVDKVGDKKASQIKEIVEKKY